VSADVRARLRGPAAPGGDLAGHDSPDPRQIHTLTDLTRALDRLRFRAAGSGQVRLSVREIAKKTGRAPSTLDPYLRGQRLCPEDTYEEMLRALGVPNDGLGLWLDAWERVAEARLPVPPVKTPEPLVTGLPRVDSYFSGRSRELSEVIAVVAANHGSRICVVHGLAGVGKTTLAVRAAGSVADWFPDGILYIDLYGYSVGLTPLAPAEALYRLLRRIGVATERIPAEDEERAALWQSLLAPRRLLLVLDNAHDVAQIRPILPPTTECAAIVTSRRRLAGLDDAGAVALDVLEPAEAAELFTQVAGRGRIAREPAAEATVSRIAARCGLLPLALRIAAARYRTNAAQRLSDLDTYLADTHTRLAVLDDEQRSAVASFQVSLSDLPAAAQRSFVLLALHPGPDFDTYAAAAIMGEAQSAAIQHLHRLVDQNLLIDHAPGRHRFHDLIVAFAREHAPSPVPPDERSAAVRRAAEYYLRAAEHADVILTPHRFRVPLEVQDHGAQLPTFANFDSARDWFAVEHANLADICLAAGAAGLDTICWQLAYTLRGYYFLTKQWQPWLVTHEAAQAAAQRCGNRRGEAMIINNLGLAYLERGDHELAAGHYRQALDMFSDLDDRHGEQTARANLAWLHFLQGQYAQFLAEAELVLAFYRRNGAVRNAAITQRGIGLAKVALGGIQEAIEELSAALATFVELDLRLDMAMTLNGLGEAYLRSGDRSRSAELFTRAVAASQESGSQFERARAHQGLGQLAADQGDQAGARRHWRSAVDDYHQLGAPQAAAVEALLSRFGEQ